MFGAMGSKKKTEVCIEVNLFNPLSAGFNLRYQAVDKKSELDTLKCRPTSVITLPAQRHLAG